MISLSPHRTRMARRLGLFFGLALLLIGCASPEAHVATTTPVTVEVDEPELGRVVSDPAGIDCGDVCRSSFAPTAPVVLEARPARGASFDGWEGDCSGSGPCELEGAGELRARARFVSGLRSDPDPEPEPTPEPDPNAPPSAEPQSLATDAETPLALELAARDPDGDPLAYAVTTPPRHGTLEGEAPFLTYTPAAGFSGDDAFTFTASDGAAASAPAAVTIAVAPPADFRIVMLPDTQNMVKTDADATQLDAMADWIIGNTGPLAIAFVTHVGDIVSKAADAEQWRRATAALDRLDGVVPYSVALGDHEYETEEDMGSPVTAYLERYGPQRWQGEETYRGSSPGGLSHYQIFRAGGRDFLHLALEWEAPGSVDDPATPLGWANDVLAAHPHLPTIVTTHAYVWDREGEEGHGRMREGYIEDEDGRRRRVGASGYAIFQQLVAPHPQVFMVLGGHYHFGDGEVHQVSRNAAGLEVFEMLANYQDYPGGGEGWLRVLHFEPGGGADGLDRISVETYSPYLDAYQTDADSRFAFDLDFDTRFGAP